MKSISMAVGILLLKTSAMAQTAKPIDSSMCPLFGSVAKTVMTKRQENVLMSELVEAIEKNMGEDNPIGNYGKAIVIQAYDVPLYATREAKDREINDFANKVMAICYAN